MDIGFIGWDDGMRIAANLLRRHKVRAWNRSVTQSIARASRATPVSTAREAFSGTLCSDLATTRQYRVIDPLLDGYRRARAREHGRISVALAAILRAPQDHGSSTCRLSSVPELAAAKLTIVAAAILRNSPRTTLSM